MTFDLDAVANEATGTPFTFTFGGEEYELAAEVDIVAAAALEGGRLYEGLRRMLGAAQLARMEASTAVLDQAKLAALLDAYKAHLGVSLGESKASTGS